MAQQKRSSGGRGSPGCLFWLLLLCVVLLLFLVNLGKIKETLARTNFTEILKTQRSADDHKVPPVTPAPVVPPEPGSGPSGGDGSAPPPAAVTSSQGGAAATGSDAAPPGGAGSGAQGGAASATGGSGDGTKGQQGTSATATSQKPAGAAGAATQAPALPAKRRAALLYFVRIEDDGSIVRQEVTRQIPASDQPMTDALAALMGGPSEEELRRHLLSLIPQGTKLLSAQVRGSTAYLNFNEAFMYNHYGIEGYAGQLKQVVFTATAFSSVQDVQILIEGQRHDYLGGEGVYIGRPLSRNSF
jgi:hypothetical protein